MGSLFDDASAFNTRARSFEAVVAEASALLGPVVELHRQLAPQLDEAERVFTAAARLAEPYGHLYIEAVTAIDSSVRRHLAEPRAHRPRPQPTRHVPPRWMLDDGPDLAWRASLEDLTDL